MKRFLSVLLIALCLVAFVSPAHAFHGVRMTYAASGSTGITVADTRLGATLALEPSGITATDWQDSSSNNLDGTYPAAGWRVFYSGQRGLLGVGQ